MKFILDKNHLLEVDKVPKKVLENSVIYSGYTEHGDEVKIYDVENGKLAPIVRYLMTGEQDNKSRFFGIIIIIIIIICLLTFFIYSFAFGEKNTKEDSREKLRNIQAEAIQKKQLDDKNINDNTREDSREKLRNIQAEAIQKKQLDDKNINDNEGGIITSFDYTLGGKESQEYQKELITEINRLNKSLLSCEKKQSHKSATEDLKKEIKKLIQEKNIISLEKQKLVKNIQNKPPDDFIYYLGELVFKNCNKQNISEILRNKCKNIYFNFATEGKNLKSE